jgi:hypothetical protein
MIQAVILKSVVKLVAKQFKLDKILEYVENPNDADKRIDKLELDVFALQQISHEPRDFIVCDKCQQKIKEKK